MSDVMWIETYVHTQTHTLELGFALHCSIYENIIMLLDFLCFQKSPLSRRNGGVESEIPEDLEREHTILTKERRFRTCVFVSL